MSKAAAARWLAESMGRTIDTVQVYAEGGREWRPGPRTLARKGNIFTLDGSRVNLDAQTTAEVDGDTMFLTWRYEDGKVIHTTTYTREKS